MVTLLATLGFEPASILPTVKARNVTRAVIFHYGEGDDGKSARAVKDVTKALGSFDVPCRAVRLKDGYDFAGCLEEIIAHARQAEQEEGPAGDVVFDITGGTKVMALAGFSVAWLLGKPVVYNIATRKENAHVHLPIEGLQDHANVGAQRERVLRLILASPPGSSGRPSATPRELREAFGAKSDSAINHHIDHLERMRAVRREHGDTLKDVRYVATPAANVLAIALEARREAGAKLAPPQDRRKRRR